MAMLAEARAGAAADGTKWEPAFDAVLNQILRDYEGTDVQVRDGMEAGMRRLFKQPYEAELAVLLGEQVSTVSTVSTEEAQRVFFFPRLSDMKLYVAAFKRDTPEGTARREKVMKFKLLSVFYTLHRKDGSLVDRFMHCGGLASLVALLQEDNRIIQSEAVELLMEMLSPLMMQQQPTSARQAHLLHQVFQCLRSDEFWANLAMILAEPAEVFPRSHAQCIRLLAGAVGWLRPEGGMLPEAATPPRVCQAVDALQRFLDGSISVSPDVRGLAQDLLEELAGVPVIRADFLRGAELVAASAALFDAETEARESAAHAWQALRRLGNEAFRAGLVWAADAAYRLALEDGVAVVPAAEASLIQSNRALVLLRAGHPREAAEAAAQAQALDPQNAKAAYRRAQALLAISPRPGAGAAGDPGAAATQVTLEAAVEAAQVARRLEPSDAKVAKLLAQAQARLAEVQPTHAADLDSMD